MDYTDEQIDFMRADLGSGMALSKMIKAAKERFEVEGRDFDKEFAAFRAKRQRVKAQAQFRIVKSMREHKEDNNY